jgi:hypothetical protein
MCLEIRHGMRCLDTDVVAFVDRTGSRVQCWAGGGARAACISSSSPALHLSAGERNGAGCAVVIVGKAAGTRSALCEVLMRRAFSAAALGCTLMFATACGSAHPASVPRTSAPSPSERKPSACQTVLTGGSSRVMVDWIDFLQIHGAQFIAGMDGQVQPLAAHEVGPVVARVRCELSVLSFSQTPGPPVDGDAAYPPLGTEVHAVKGFAASCRVAASVHGVYRVYLAHHDVGGRSTPLPCAIAPQDRTPGRS